MHILPTCKSINEGTTCLRGKDCNWGHDFAEVRRDLFFMRKRIGRRNFETRGGIPGEKGHYRPETAVEKAASQRATDLQYGEKK